MNLCGLQSRGVPVSLMVAGLLCSVPLSGSVRAAPPLVSISPGSVRVQVTSASVADAVDALSRAAGFKVTYEGPRPSGMIFNSEINTPSVAETLSRLLDGQNLNYGVVFDLTGLQVTSLMVLGPAANKAVTTAPGSSGPVSRPFTPPRNPRNDLPPVDDDPAEDAEPEPPPALPEPTASASPDPAGPPVPADTRTVPLPPSPFSPRPLVISPFAPRATPSPSP